MNEDVQRFIDAIPDDRRPLFDKLHALILNLYPDTEIVISYGVPTYKARPGWVALGYWKQGVSLHTGGLHHLDEFREKYPAIKTGKGSINFKITDEIPVADVEKVIKHAIEHLKPSQVSAL